jgi:hypothetical protein
MNFVPLNNLVCYFITMFFSRRINASTTHSEFSTKDYQRVGNCSISYDFPDYLLIQEANNCIDWIWYIVFIVLIRDEQSFKSVMMQNVNVPGNSDDGKQLHQDNLFLSNKSSMRSYGHEPVKKYLLPYFGIGDQFNLRTRSFPIQYHLRIQFLIKAQLTYVLQWHDSNFTTKPQVGNNSILNLP